MPRLSPILFTLLVACAGDKSPSQDSALDTEPAVDADGDGAVATDDCDDADPAVYPGAAEACDGLDNNCDGAVDEGALSTFYADGDADGYGVESAAVEACEAPSGHAAAAGDCDDGDPASFPGAAEVCDGVDNSCDGAVDEGALSVFYADGDADGYGVESSAVEACEAPSGYAAVAGDCDDADPALTPEDYDADGVSSCGGDCDDADPDRLETCGYSAMDGEFNVPTGGCVYGLLGVGLEEWIPCPSCDFAFDTEGVLATATDCLSDFEAILAFDIARSGLAFHLRTAPSTYYELGFFPATLTKGEDYDVLSFYGYGATGNPYGGTLNLRP
jgi:hypothetical protein